MSHAGKLERRRVQDRRKYKTDEAYRANIAANNAKFRMTERGRAIAKRAQDKYRASNREKVAARAAVNHAIEAGRLISPLLFTCTHCKHSAKHYHHHNGYDPAHWLDVVPVCTRCHGLLG